MAKPRTPRAKKSGTTANGTSTNGNTGVSNPGLEAQTVTPVSAETKLQTAAEVKPQGPTEAKKNLVPINLEEEIRRRAYEIFAERGHTPGNEHEDWVRAEREVRSRYLQTA